MKKQAKNTPTQTVYNGAEKDTFSRVLLIAAIVLYSAALVLLANLALADVAKVGALIKVNSQLDGDAFHNLNAEVKTVSGNILAVNIPQANVNSLNSVNGLCASAMDVVSTTKLSLQTNAIQNKYAGSGVVVGVLDNNGALSAEAVAQLQKVERVANIGFISYLTDDASSNVIMTNLASGESNLIQSLLYMQQYAQTVEKPLVVELRIGEAELSNPLFVQVCQKFADKGVQFLGSAITSAPLMSKAPVQLSFSMYNAKTGALTDQSDFWAIEEVKQQQIMLLGSDQNTCNIFFQNEAGFDKVYLSNSSNDIVMVTAISADGSVNYYHVTNKETALIPRELANGTPMLEDGLGGVYPYYSKGIVFNGAVASKQFVAIGQTEKVVELQDNQMALTVGSPSGKTLSMSVENLSENVNIQITDESGATVYRNQPDQTTQSIKTRIDLSDGVGGLYFLDLTSPTFHQTFALQID